MQMLIEPGGVCSFVYCEQIEFSQIGTLSIRRASHVEVGSDNRWRADLSAVGGPMLGPFMRRSDALNAELAWLETWLASHRGSRTYPASSRSLDRCNACLNRFCPAPPLPALFAQYDGG